MHYSTFIPDSRLHHLVECFWSVTGVDTSQQKIVPDGFPEIIFHFGDPYELVDESGTSSKQQLILISGQISKPVLLRASGKSDVFGIKFKPSGIWKLLGIDMSTIKDRIIPLEDVDQSISRLYDALKNSSTKQRIKIFENFFSDALTLRPVEDEVSAIVSTIESQNGNISIEALCDHHHITSRKLQRIFQQQVGIRAKQYSRIVRFRTVYALIQKPSLTKSDSLYLTGYFDQPHFNKEFREFTQENPERWFEENHAFANLFMNR